MLYSDAGHLPDGGAAPGLSRNPRLRWPVVRRGVPNGLAGADPLPPWAERGGDIDRIDRTAMEEEADR